MLRLREASGFAAKLTWAIQPGPQLRFSSLARLVFAAFNDDEIRAGSILTIRSQLFSTPTPYWISCAGCSGRQRVRPRSPAHRLCCLSKLVKSPQKHFVVLLFVLRAEFLPSLRDLLLSSAFCGAGGRDVRYIFVFWRCRRGWQGC